MPTKKNEGKTTFQPPASNNRITVLKISRWNPFRISRDEAENLLQGSYAGAFIFSHSVTSEAFLSMRYGE